MEYDQSTLPDDAAELKKIVLDIQEQSTKTEVDYQAEINHLNEQIRILRQTIFGTKSEKNHIGKSPQLPLFDMPENLPGEPCVDGL